MRNYKSKNLEVNVTIQRMAVMNGINVKVSLIPAE